jgi:beta-galactosidase beta subunit
MIIDNIQNASSYFSLHPLFDKAFQYILQTNIDTAAPGKYTIDEGLNAIVNIGMGKTKEEV